MTTHLGISLAYDINDYGQVVGNKYSHEPYSANAVLWDCGETIYLRPIGLGSLATAINYQFSILDCPEREAAIEILMVLVRSFKEIRRKI